MKWKIVILVFLCIIVIFGIVTLFKTITITSKQPEPEPTSIRPDENRAVKRFQEAITYQTISYQERHKMNLEEFTRFLNFLSSSYPLVHEELDVTRINDYALLYKWEGSNSSNKPIGLTGHYDVVPVLEGTESNWDNPPFSGQLENGIIWGRGTLDDKIGVIGILEAVEILLSDGFIPSRDVYLMFGFDEEIGGDLGAKAIAQSLKDQGVQFEFVLDEGGAIVENMVPGVSEPVGVIGISEKGSAIAELTIEGTGGHSSQPKDQTNIGRIASAIAKLEETQFDGKLLGPGNDLFEFVAPEMNFPMKYVFANKMIFRPIIENILLQEPSTAALIRTTIAPTIFQAGEQYNAIPEKATAIINLRLMPGDTLEEVKSFIEKTIDDEGVTVTVTGSEASKVSSVDGLPFQSVQQAARNVYENAVIAPYLMFAGSDARHYDLVSENTYRFLPVLISSEDLNRMHGTNEHISVENYLNAIKFYAELIQVATK